MTRAATLAPPLAAVCRLQVRRKKVVVSQTFFSSGAYIGDGLVLTAAHNLHSMCGDSVEAVAAECGVTVHQDGAGRLETFTRNDVADPPNYHFKFYPEDTALLRVPAATATSAFEIAPDDLVLPPDQEVHLAGFPGNGYTQNGEFMYESKAKALKVTDLYLLYAITTATGNSGGPVWVERDGHFYIVGVHVAGEGPVGTARRVSRSRLTQLRQFFGRGS
jgi:V8-like Glu-specific endopeptidase